MYTHIKTIEAQESGKEEREVRKKNKSSDEALFCWQYFIKSCITCYEICQTMNYNVRTVLVGEIRIIYKLYTTICVLCTVLCQIYIMNLLHNLSSFSASMFNVQDRWQFRLSPLDWSGSNCSFNQYFFQTLLSSYDDLKI